PPGILACVEGKLRGYTWNLVDGYGFSIEVSEVALDSIRRALFPAASGFVPEPLPSLPFNGTLLDEPAFCVRTAHLDHRIYSLRSHTTRTSSSVNLLFSMRTRIRRPGAII